MGDVAKKLAIASDPFEARKVEEEVLDAVVAHSYGKAAAFAIKLAVEEGLNNAIKHGNGEDPRRRVEIDYEVTDEAATISIADEGPGFSPDDVPDPTADENLERPCGRGIMLMRAYMDSVRYNARGNRVTLVKRKCPEPPTPGTEDTSP